MSLHVALGLIALALAIGPACGGSAKPPTRGVYEQDVEGWSFRRYQALLDVEVWVPKNRGEAHTASYVRPEGLKRGRIDEDDIVNVIVTRYERKTGVARGLIRFVRRLARESGYQLEEKKVEATQVISIKGSDEAWLMWASDRHIVKIGGRGRTTVPSSIVERYARAYPSRVAAGALDSPLPDGPDYTPEAEDAEPFDEDNPRPEWDVKAKEKKSKK